LKSDSAVYTARDFPVDPEGKERMNISLRKRDLILVLVVICSLVSFTLAQNSPHASSSGYTPQRVYSSREKRFTDFEAMLAELSRADVVFVGEQHDDPNTHRLERAILEGLARRRTSIALALEMFERDVQPALDDYIASRLTEEDFLKASRPWPRYATDYRPLLEFARAHKWPIVAGNVPRRYASQVAKTGLASLDSLPPAERAFVAKDIQCPPDDYFKRFSEAMNQHPASSNAKASDEENARKEAERRETTNRLYQAQCIKDETMAESVAALYQGKSKPDAENASALVVHFNGAFHSDYHLGTAARVKQRAPKAAIRVVTILPVADLDALTPDTQRKRADYLIFTLQQPKPRADAASRQ
jgi:uncharacterized iron-regulated protein